ncbi:MAG: hypothetical protein JNN11_01720 [Candidatus Doudnabacteria bacterium]|nr:hypothetical protein [Candidatus Doudnabacteria bacterium]
MKKFLIATFLFSFIAAGCAGQSSTTNNNQASGQKASGGNSEQVKVYTMSEIALANSAENCLSVVNSKVYNLTEWIKKHPGGQKAILGICGQDGTEAFTKQHGGGAKFVQTLSGFYAGELAK